MHGTGVSVFSYGGKAQEPMGAAVIIVTDQMVGFANVLISFTDHLHMMMQEFQPSTSGRKAQESVWTAIINFERQGKADAGEAEAKPGSKKAARYIVDVLANCAEDSLPGHGPKR